MLRQSFQPESRLEPISGRILTLPPERRIHPAPPSTGTTLPHECDVPIPEPTEHRGQCQDAPPISGRTADGLVRSARRQVNVYTTLPVYP
jgi:hypothetical protein